MVVLLKSKKDFSEVGNLKREMKYVLKAKKELGKWLDLEGGNWT